MVPVPPDGVAFNWACVTPDALHAFSRVIATVGGVFSVSTNVSVAAGQLVPAGPAILNCMVTVPDPAKVTFVLAAFGLSIVTAAPLSLLQVMLPPAGTTLPALLTVKSRSERAPVLQCS